MAQLEDAEESSGSAGEITKPKSRSLGGNRSNNKKAVEVEPSDKSDQDHNVEGGDGEEDEEEYEIEEILDSKRGMFGKKNEWAYLVKWKGYSSEHNSWVPEQDAGNAQDLINDFLAKRAKAKESATRLSSVRGRKPASAKASRIGRDASAGTESASTTKRGRRKASSDEDEDDSDSARKAKKSRGAHSTNGTTSGKRGALAALDRTDDDDSVTMADANESRPYTSMKALKMGSMKSWEDVVKNVTTVEQHDEQLMIFFELNDGHYVREPSEQCRKRFPQKLLDFYETHLRWRTTDGDEGQSH